MDILHYLQIEKQTYKVPAQDGLFVKYQPQTLHELECYLPAGVPEQLQRWVACVIHNQTVVKNIALLVGPSGSMKSLLVKLIAAQLNREPESIATLSVDPTLLCRRGSQLVITADAMEGFDGTSVDTVKHLARAHPRLPIFVYCCSELYGRVTELGRLTAIFSVGPPSESQLIKYAKHILSNEGLDTSVAGKLVKGCSQDFCQVASSIALNRHCLSKACVIFEKDPRKDALTIIKEHMFSANPRHLRSVESMFNVFASEGGLFTSLVAENYVDAADTIEAAAAAAEDVSAGDTMEASLYATQGWSLLDAWICQSAVIPCCRVRTHSGKPLHKPRFSKLWSLFSNISQRSNRFLQVRHVLASSSKHLHSDHLEVGISISSMIWSLVKSGHAKQLTDLLLNLGVHAELAHHLARMSGKSLYKPVHHKAIKALDVKRCCS